MKHLTKAILVLGAMTLAACTNANRFDNDGVVDLNSSANSGSALSDGGANDPTSPAYFQHTIGDRVLFEVDQSSLTSTGRATLNGQANWLKTNADYVAIIEGHADEQGTREYNLALGARRSNTVREYLVSQGVPAARLRTVSYGKERPIEICSQESCYTQNRRAVTIISAGLSS